MRKRKMLKGTYSPLESSYHGFPYSFFYVGRLVTGVALVIGIPFLILKFNESYVGMLRIAIAFSVCHLLCYITKKYIGE